MSKDSKPMPTQKSLIGKNIYLRAATTDDIANFHYWKMQCDPQMMTVHPQLVLTATEAVERFKNSKQTDSHQSLCIVRKKDNQPLGKITFFNFNHLNRSAELGVLIDPDEQQNNYASEAMKVLIKYLFTARNLNKVYATTSELNQPTIALLESIGFKKDGVMRNHHYYNGEYHNQLAYSFLRFELDW